MNPVLSRPARATALPAVLLAALCLALPVAAQERTEDGKVVVPANGTEAFRGFLGQWNVKPVRSLTEMAAEPQRTLLVVLGGPGELNVGREWMGPKSLEEFVARGGAVLFATDRDSAPVWDSAFDVHIAAANVLAADSADRYRPDVDDPRLDLCPLVRPERHADPDLFDSLPAAVATNRTGVLSRTGRRAPPLLAGFGPSVAVLVGRGSLEDLAPGDGFARGGVHGGGKLLFLADHSIFINALMVPTDNGNFDFAYNALDWLTTNAYGKRTRDRCLFIEEGKVTTRFDALDGRPEIPIPSPEQLLALGNEALQGAQRDDLLNKLTADANRAFFSALPLPRVLAVLAFLGALALVIAGLVRFLSARSPNAVTAPSNAGAWYRTVPIFEQRQHALVQSGNLYLLTQDRVRAGLLELGAPQEAEAPALAVRGGYWSRRHWNRVVGRLAKLAWATSPQAVSSRQAQDLQRDLQRLRQAVNAGVVRFDPVGTA